MHRMRHLGPAIPVQLGSMMVWHDLWKRVRQTGGLHGAGGTNSAEVSARLNRSPTATSSGEVFGRL
jgi:hypothetical protein